MLQLTVLCPGMIFKMDANLTLFSFLCESQISVVPSCDDIKKTNEHQLHNGI